MNNAPCKTCVHPIRHTGCHASCEQYIEWKYENDRQSKEIRKNREQHNAPITYAVDTIEKIKRNMGYK